MEDGSGEMSRTEWRVVLATNALLLPVCIAMTVLYGTSFAAWLFIGVPGAVAFIALLADVMTLPPRQRHPAQRKPVVF